jgi:arsenical pump membrane protein
MSILYSNLCNNLTGVAYYQGIYASIIGSNIGAFLTPMGALAGIMFTGLLEKHDVKLSFVQFSKYGSVIALPTITTALGILLLTINF